MILTTLAFSSIITSAMQNSEQANESQKTNLVNKIKLTEENHLENLYKEFYDECFKFHTQNNFLKFQNEAEKYKKACEYLIKENLTEKDIEEYVHNCYIVEPPIEKNPDAKKNYEELILENLKDELLDSYKKIKKTYTKYMSSIENLKNIKNLRNKELLKKFRLTTEEVEEKYKNIEKCMQYVQDFENEISIYV